MTFEEAVGELEGRLEALKDQQQWPEFFELREELLGLYKTQRRNPR